MMMGVVVLVIAAPWPPCCPHPSPLPPSGSGHGCCEGVDDGGGLGLGTPHCYTESQAAMA